WVRLNNKTGTPYSVNNPSAFLSQKAITRRSFHNIAIDTKDLPVSPNYINLIDNVANVTVLYASKWLNGLVVSVPSSSSTALNTINSFSFVLGTGQVNSYKINIPKLNEPPIDNNQTNLKTTLSNTLSGFNYGGSYWQNKQLNLDCLHNKGYRGKGVTIAVLDAGFYNVDINPLFDSLRAYGRIIGTRDFVNGGTSVYEDNYHGMAVLSCMAANKPGVILGSAPDSFYWLLRTEDVNFETISEEYNWIRGAEFADSVGADILTTSLGYTQFDNSTQNHNYSTLNGKTAPMSIAATIAARKGLFVLNSAGNEGGGSWQYIGVPADADSICTVGAVDSLGIVANFSSTGPTFDGRIKPDLVARGVGAWVSFSNGQCGPGNGTSFATPILAGAIACFWQSHSNYNNIKLLDTLRKIASNAINPNNSIGWGITNMCTIPVGIENQNFNTNDNID
ncbi:MAG: peptidase S8, partial [Sphingobacteriia bacterium]|nr:peptidase S8 [Candidatus Fonsibacter lacus]